MSPSLPETPSVLLAAGTCTGAGTTVALVEACRTLSAQLASGRVADVEVHLPADADRAAQVAAGLDVVRLGRWRSITSEMLSSSTSDIYIGFADRLPLKANSQQFRVMVVQNPHLYQESDAPSLGTVAREVRARWARRSARSADLVICATEASRTTMLSAVNGLVPERLVVRPIRPDTPAPDTVCKEVVSNVVLLGDLYSYKRFDVALDGISAWAAERGGDPVRVVHCGSGRDAQALDSFRVAAERARQAGVTVHERGAVSHEHAMAELAAADVLVSASEVETQGLTIVEAMAVGLPVVARGIGPVLDIAGDAIEAFPIDGGADDVARSLRNVEGAARRRELAQRGISRAAMAVGWDLLPER